MGLSEVAVEAGTSISTVSRVLNGAKGAETVNPQLAKRVLKVAKELNYQPNMLGRSLRLNVESEFGPDFSQRETENISEKKMIAKLAAQSCPYGALIGLDSGSTVAELASYVPEDVIVYTNSLAPIQTLAKRGIFTHLAPGLYVPPMKAVFGLETEEYFRSHPVSYYFLSSARIDVNTGLYNINSITVGVKRPLLESSSVNVLLADHNKFVDLGLKSYTPLSDIDILVTDFIPEQFRETLLGKIPIILETKALVPTPEGI